MDFPSSISLTLTNRCNLRCEMCGQWSKQGYMRQRTASLEQEMSLVDWKRLVDELADHSISSVLLRGGEPFLFPGIIELLNYIHSKGIFISIDTNGTQLAKYAADIVRIGKVHLTISVDGPEGIHDAVRGVKGCFKQVQAGLAWLGEIEHARQRPISRSITFTISHYSDIARSLGIKTICIVPYYYFPETVGQRYEQEMKEIFDCEAFSWRGFHHEDSGVEADEFIEGYRRYRANLGRASLGEVYSYPYMTLSEGEYRAWFSDATSPVGPQHCTNVEKLIDIQPNGEANFCVDFPDYSIGNVRQASIEQVWNGERAERFRQYRREKPLAVCYRCGAKYMSEIQS
jgi:MoaA/NifB/PqqE/SkfB family radical SAM enzyme